MVQLLLDPRILALLPLFVYSNWMYAYQFTCFNGQLFTPRTRGLNDAFYWGLQMLGSCVIGAYLDWQRLSIRRRALFCLMAVYIVVAASWVLGVIANERYKLDAGMDGIEVLDFSRSTASWVAPFLLFCLCVYVTVYCSAGLTGLWGRLATYPRCLAALPESTSLDSVSVLSSHGA